MFGNLDFISLFGGLGMFLFGMYQMEDAIRKLSGSALRKILRIYTSNTLKAVLTGIVVTTILQSSSAVSLIILALVGAGVMTMPAAIGLILGANIGSTTTGWIVATLGFKLNIESFALPLIGLGGLLLMLFSEKKTVSKFFQLMLSVGLLFLGLNFMKESVERFAEVVDIAKIPNYGTFVYFLLGLVTTLIMQASSATVAVVLAALNAKLIEFPSAAAMVIGADVGTTITIILGAIGGNAVKMRVAYAQVGFNLITGLLALIALPLLVVGVSNVFDLKSNAVQALVLFHTSFNLLGVLIFMPFVGYFTKLLEWLIKEKKVKITQYIDNVSLDMPDTALLALRKESEHLLHNILRFNLSILKIDEKLIFNATKEPLPQYEDIKRLQAEIMTFAIGVQTREISTKEVESLNQMLHGLRMALHSAKTLKDIRHDFEAFEHEENAFLNAQFVHFRKRMVETYLKVDALLSGDTDNTDRPALLAALLSEIKKEDKRFLSATTEAIQNKAIEDLNLSTAIVANRAFVQSARQILLAIRDLMLNEAELAAFEKIQGPSDEFLENGEGI